MASFFIGKRNAESFMTNAKPPTILWIQIQELLPKKIWEGEVHKKKAQKSTGKTPEPSKEIFQHREAEK